VDIGLVDFEIIGLTKIGKKETEEKHKPAFDCCSAGRLEVSHMSVQLVVSLVADIGLMLCSGCLNSVAYRQMSLIATLLLRRFSLG